MRYPFNYKALALAVASVSMAMTAHGAAMDRSGQDITGFLQDGTYADATYTYLHTEVSGKDASGNTVPNMTENYDFFRYTAKADVNDTVSIGVLYDQPFGALVNHSGNSNFVAGTPDNTISALTSGRFSNVATAQTTLTNLTGAINMYDSQPALRPIVLAGLQGQGIPSIEAARATQTQLAAAIAVANEAGNNAGEATNVRIDSNNLTALVGVKFGENKNFQIYGGPAAQRVNGEVHLRGVAYQAMNGYDSRLEQDTAVGWVAGVAYSKPEIALRASLTYRSEIEHETMMAEHTPALAARGLDPNTVQPFSITTPESWNLDFQTGINPTTLLTAKVRYVPWSDTEIRPPVYARTIAAGYPSTAPAGRPIASWTKDQWSAEIGLGKRVTDKLALAAQVGWDSGAGNPTTSLGPVDGYYSVGLGAKYNFTPEWSLSVGGRYMKFGDADPVLPTHGVDGATNTTVGHFEDNDGYAVGVKLAYQRR